MNVYFPHILIWKLCFLWTAILVIIHWLTTNILMYQVDSICQYICCYLPDSCLEHGRPLELFFYKVWFCIIEIIVSLAWPSGRQFHAGFIFSQNLPNICDTMDTQKRTIFDWFSFKLQFLVLFFMVKMSQQGRFFNFDVKDVYQ